MTDFQTREVTRIRFKDWDSVEVLNLEKLILTFEAKAKSQDIGALCYLSRAVKSTQDRSNGRPVDLRRSTLPLQLYPVMCASSALHLRALVFQRSGKQLYVPGDQGRP